MTPVPVNIKTCCGRIVLYDIYICPKCRRIRRVDRGTLPYPSQCDHYDERFTTQEGGCRGELRPIHQNELVKEFFVWQSLSDRMANQR